IRFFRSAKPFERRDVASGGVAHGKRARTSGRAAHEHRAGPALAQTAAEFRPIQRERTAQYVEKRLRGIPTINGDPTPIESERIRRHQKYLIGQNGFCAFVNSSRVASALRRKRAAGIELQAEPEATILAPRQFDFEPPAAAAPITSRIAAAVAGELTMFIPRW